MPGFRLHDKTDIYIVGQYYICLYLFVKRSKAQRASIFFQFLRLCIQGKPYPWITYNTKIYSYSSNKEYDIKVNELIWQPFMCLSIGYKTIHMLKQRHIISVTQFLKIAFKSFILFVRPLYYYGAFLCQEHIPVEETE